MPGILYVRDSKDKTGPKLSFGPREFSAFAGHVGTLNT